MIKTMVSLDRGPPNSFQSIHSFMTWSQHSPWNSLPTIRYHMCPMLLLPPIHSPLCKHSDYFMNQILSCPSPAQNHATVPTAHGRNIKAGPQRYSLCRAQSLHPPLHPSAETPQLSLRSPSGPHPFSLKKLHMK